MGHCEVTLSFCSASFCLMPADNRMRAVSVRRFPERSRDSRVLFSFRATPRASAPFSPNPFQPRLTVCKRTLSWKDWKEIGSWRKKATDFYNSSRLINDWGLSHLLPWTNPALQAWMSNSSNHKVWDKIIYPFLNFNNADIVIFSDSDNSLSYVRWHWSIR